MSSSSTVVGGVGNATHEERSRRALIDQAKRINRQGHDVLEAEGQVAGVASDIQTLDESNPDLLRVHSSVVMRHIVFLFGIFCVYCLDVILFGATAEYAVSLITGNWLLMLLGKYGVPLFFLGIEVLCSIKMIEAGDEAKAREEVPTYGW